MKKIILIVLTSLFVSLGSVSANEKQINQGLRYYGAGLTVKLDHSAAYIRQGIINGKVLGTVSNGKIIDVYDLGAAKIQNDGYQWFGGQGLCIDGKYHAGDYQYDYNVMHLRGVPIDYSQMFLFSSAATIRKTIQGDRITVVPNGKSFTVLEYYDTVQSDGYRWMKVDYEGNIGYAQYDPAVMRPSGK